ADITFDGTAITGTNIGLSDDNCWGFSNSHAYRADVTSLVDGNGDYPVANLIKDNADISGLSLVVFYDDGNEANDRDLVMFEGNDSTEASDFDTEGWHVTLPGINYESGTVTLDFHVADGQEFEDGAVLLNGATVFEQGAVFQGDSVPNG